MAALPDPGITRYGAYTFPSNVETTAISIVPQYDQAGRTVIYNRIKLSMRAVLTGTAIDAAVRAVTQVLTKPAYQFVYSGRGYGLNVNVGNVRDVVWGPKPTEASVKPLGGGHAAELTWSVEVCIPDGPSARFDTSPMEFGYTLTYDVDASGYTTRTYQAFVSVPTTRKAPLDRSLADSADRFREQITPPMVDGFRRTSTTSSLSLDKMRLDLTCQDVQLPPYVPPAGVIDCSASHSLQSIPGQIYKWMGTIDASYEIARNGAATIAAARDAFFALVKDRLKHTIDSISTMQTTELRTGGGGGNGLSAACIPISFTMAEPDLYGRTKAKFSLSYSVSGANLKTMLQASGLWRPVPGSDWRKWSASVGGILGPRGHAGLIFSPNVDDRIVDLLGPVPPSASLLASLNQRGQHSGAIPQGVFPEPTPDRSWLHYVNAIFLETDSGVVQVRTLPTEARTAPGDLYGPSAGGGVVAAGIMGAIGAASNALTNSNPFYFPPPRKPDQQKKGGMGTKQTPQRRGRQTGVIYMIGRAVRVKFAIPAPSADKWGEATLTPANRPDRGEGFWTAVVGNALWPVHAAQWKLRYVMDTVPSETAPALSNPFYGGGGVDAAALGSEVGDVIGNAATAAFGVLGG